MSYLQVFRLVKQYGPELALVVRKLLEQFGGDEGRVRTELRRIADHGVRGEAAEAEYDARVAAARTRIGGGD